MKKRVWILLVAAAVLACAIAAACLALSARYSGTVIVTEHGVTANSPDRAAANRRALNRMLRWAKPGTTLVFPEGDYYIAASRLGGVTIAHKHSITLRGENAALLNASYTPASASLPTYQTSSLLAVRSSTDVTIEGLTLDYVQHTSVSGTITETRGGTAIFRAYDEFLTGENPVRGGECAHAVNLFDADGNPVREAYLPTIQPLEAVEGEPGLFAVPGLLGEVGQQVCVRFTSGTYACPALTLHDVSGLTVRDVTIRSCPSASVYATGDNADFTFDRLTVAPQPTSRSLFSSNEDCIHIQGLRGALTLTGCTFEGIGDDALNVHSLAAVIDSINHTTLTLTLQNGRTGEPMPNWASPGDRIEFYDRSLNLLGSATATQTSGSKLTLDSIPASVREGMILHNASRVPAVAIESCTVKRGRARGFLLQAPTVAVRNCTFESLGLSAILIAPDVQSWYEMGPCAEATLTGNTFLRCGLHDPAGRFAAICVATNHELTPASAAAPHGAITATQNRFTDCPANLSIQGAQTILTDTPNPN